MEQRTLKIGDRIIYCYEDGSVEFLSTAIRHKKNPLVRTFGMTDRHGYKSIQLKVDGKIHNFRVHRLITMAFHPNPSNLPEVDHINRNKEDNRPCNLRWCTRKENNNNKYYIDKSLAKYGIRKCENKRLYCEAYRSTHVTLTIIQPNGKKTSKSFESVDDPLFLAMKPLSMKERFYMLGV